MLNFVNGYSKGSFLKRNLPESGPGLVDALTFTYPLTHTVVRSGHQSVTGCEITD